MATWLKTSLICSVLTVVVALAGCVASPRVQLSAADSMDLPASSLAAAVEDCRREMEKSDDERRKAAVHQ